MLRSPEPDYAGMRERMDAVRLRAMLDPGALTEHDLMCLAFEQPACPSCGAGKPIPGDSTQGVPRTHT